MGIFGISGREGAAVDGEQLKAIFLTNVDDLHVVHVARWSFDQSVEGTVLASLRHLNVFVGDGGIAHSRPVKTTRDSAENLGNLDLLDEKALGRRVGDAGFDVV